MDEPGPLYETDFPAWAEAWEEAVAALPDGALPAEPLPCPIPVWPLLERGFRPRDAL